MATNITNKASEYSFRRLKLESKYLDTIHKQIQAAGPSRSKKLQNIEAQENRTCRLLFKDKSLIGFIIYKREPQKVKNYSNTFKIDLFQCMENHTESDQKELLRRVELLAADRGSEHMAVKLPNTKQAELDFFLTSGFNKASTYSKSKEFVQNLLVKEIKVPGKREETQSEGGKDEKKNESKKRQRISDDISEKRIRTAPLPQNRSTQPIGISFKRVQHHTDDTETRRPSQPIPDSHYARGDYPYQEHSLSHPQQYNDRQVQYQSPRGSRIQNNQRFDARPRVKEITLKKLYVHQIQAGRKTVEGRINSGMVKAFRVGDTIRFFYKQDPNDDVECKITDIRAFRTFREMLIDSGFKKCVSETYSLEHAENIYLNIPGYPARAGQHGVVALHLEVTRNPFPNRR